MIQTVAGNATAPAMEPTDTYLVNATARMNTTRAIKSAYGASARKTPAVVAMPLPPLNFNQQV